MEHSGMAENVMSRLGETNPPTEESNKNVGEINPGEDEACAGFINPETRVDWLMQSKFFPSKVGGKPAWLALDGLPSPQQLLCRLCHQPTLLLMQLYLPDSRHDYSFHRTMFVFACPAGQCTGAPHESEGLRVFRCNLPRRNPFYPFEAPDESQQVPLGASPCAQDKNAICRVCGGLADSTIAMGPGNASYCHQNHKDIHDRLGDACESVLFKQAEVTLDPEDDEKNDEDVEDEDEEIGGGELSQEQIDEQMRQVKEMFPNQKIGFNEDPGDYKQLEDVALADTDRDYMNFMEYVEDFADQEDDSILMLRYDRFGKALHPSNRYKPGPNVISSCEHCGKKRQFEFQVLPHLLNFLDVDKVKELSFDFGTIIVYTCFCQTSLNYTEEQIFKQDFIENIKPTHLRNVSYHNVGNGSRSNIGED